ITFIAVAANAATSDWWDPAYAFRQNVVVQTGPNLPDKGYAAYTLRITGFDTASLIAAGEMRGDCRDLRVLFHDGAAWQERPRHVLGCNGAATDIRFQAGTALPAAAGDDNYYLYYGNPAAAAPSPLTTTNVYLWYDDALADRSGSYVRGRIDPWHGSGWDDSLVHDPSGYYRYSNGDNFTSGYRRGVDERDVYIEAEFFHTDCFPINMTSGLVVRGIVQSGSGGSETSNHYYASNRGEFPTAGCGNAAGYGHDGAIMRNQRNQIAVGGTNPGDIVPNQWRRQALAAWGVNPTALKFWDEDAAAAWAAPAFAGPGNVLNAGTDATDVEGRGFVAVMTAQDQARVRNVFVRRYVEPEPGLSVGPQQLRSTPELTVFKVLTTLSDPVGGTANPFNIPGAVVEYTIRVTNSAAGTVDNDSVSVVEPVPAALALIVTDVSPGSGPVEFVDGSGAASSGLTVSFTALTSTGDDVGFSQDGVDFSYAPVAGADGSDGSVTHFRVRPRGVMAGAATVPTEFSLTYRLRVR
ncbi:MAG: hypothetical protein AAFX58_10550, partial [Pseudomonadota bacterium]